ncbi:hypothetical protein E1B28_000450 [Marasmius oreades]|uniref:Uncharacterized protein n=1 Tax=Marasmius oreades TaxID=181124 RepID=A0A9P7V1G0_9AGAR|nr:uncharacterized protein E1B28_000450 [Marasmius oreades]KAG7098506.1 hypothetical protein E1B28_000450 [Marasmius oreades]
MPDPETQSSHKQAPRPSPLFNSLFAGTIAASVLISSAFWLRRRKNIQFSGSPPRTTIKRGGPNRFHLPTSSSSDFGPPKRVVIQRAHALPQLSYSPPPPEESPPSTEEGTPEDLNKEPVQLDFNPAFLTIKAFGIATFAVAIGTIGLVWGVKNTMGVDTTEQFAQRMRELIITRMPILSSRIHRSHLDENAGLKLHLDPHWNWDKAEERLKDAYDKDGISGWVEAAVRELEAEEAVERGKRAITESGGR